MSIDSAHKSKWAIAEIVFGIPLLIGIAIQFVVPMPISQGIIRLTFILLGIALIIAGLWVIVSGRREFARFDQPTDPGHPTSRIVKTGVFAISRNPLYLGCVFFLLGVAFTLNNTWALITLLLSIILCHYILIAPEEQYLAAKFGEEYREYTASVHRWFGHK
jgi:protein-S-isoprenylcysteine O-methyltransferase Ste14